MTWRRRLRVTFVLRRPSVAASLWISAPNMEQENTVLRFNARTPPWDQGRGHLEVDARSGRLALGAGKRVCLPSQVHQSRFVRIVAPSGEILIIQRPRRRLYRKSVDNKVVAAENLQQMVAARAAIFSLGPGVRVQLQPSKPRTTFRASHAVQPHQAPSRTSAKTARRRSLA